MKVVFRTDSGNHIGSGHVVRCLTLADRLKEKGCEIHFITRQHAGYISLENTGFVNHVLEDGVNKEVVINDYGQWLGVSLDKEISDVQKILTEYGPFDCMVIDHYALGINFEEQMPVQVLVAVDDLTNRKHHCSIFLNQNLGFYQSDYQTLVNQNSTKFLLGPKYALLKKNFSEQRININKFKKKPIAVGIYFGSTDPTREVLKVANSLIGNKLNNYFFNLILPEKHLDYKEVKRICSQQDNLNLNTHVDDMAKFLADCDIFFGACGATSWERCCLGVPTFAVVVAENQKIIGNSLARAGVINLLGKGEETDVQTWRKVLFRLASEKEALKKMSEKALNICDGEGAERVVEEILRSFE